MGRDELRGADPPMFAGNQQELEGWITACRLGFTNQPSKFHSESKKITWAASFLSGPPLSWLQPSINRLLMGGELSASELETFETFIQALRDLYGDPNLERNAMAALRNLHQITSVVEYHSRFVSHSQYTKLNDVGLAEYFYHALKEDIKYRLAEQEGWASLKDLQQKATRIDS